MKVTASSFTNFAKSYLPNPLNVLRDLAFTFVVVPGTLLFAVALLFVSQAGLKDYLQSQRDLYSTFQFSDHPNDAIPVCAVHTGTVETPLPYKCNISVKSIDEVTANVRQNLLFLLVLLWAFSAGLSFIWYGFRRESALSEEDRKSQRLNSERLDKFPLKESLGPILSVIEQSGGKLTGLHTSGAHGIVIAFQASLEVGHALSRVCDDERRDASAYYWMVSGRYEESGDRTEMVWILEPNDRRLSGTSEHFHLDDVVLTAQFKRMARKLEQRLAIQSAELRADSAMALR
jgi:hypothetical protein